jgi:HAD superfamily hydrolase (TIGR01548 family)
MQSLGLDAQRSQANFVFARSPKADWIRDGMAGLGIGVRGWPEHPSLSDAVRINVPGDLATTTRLHQSLRAVLKPEAILFDVDGVLVDVSTSYRQAILRTAAHFGVKLNPEDIAAAKAKGNANNDWVLTRNLLLERGVEQSMQAVTAVFETLYQGTADAPGLKLSERARFSRVELENLRRHYRLAIVTGRPRQDAVAFLEREGWSDLFETAVVMGETAPKPDPAPVREALSRLGVTAAWMIGDTVDDIVAARKAGVVPIGMLAPGEDPVRGKMVLLRAGAARVIETPGDLEALLP